MQQKHYNQDHDRWNNSFPVCTEVVIGIGEKKRKTKTTSPAQDYNGIAFVFLDNEFATKLS